MFKKYVTCDECAQEIGEKKHISLDFGYYSQKKYSGIAVPPNKKKVAWTVITLPGYTFKHFCNGTCIGKYFDELIKKVK